MTLHFAVIQIYLIKFDFNTISPAENRRPNFLHKNQLLPLRQPVEADMRAVIEDIMSAVWSIVCLVSPGPFGRTDCQIWHFGRTDWPS